MLQQMKYADNITEIMPIRIEILLKQRKKDGERLTRTRYESTMHVIGTAELRK